MNNDKQAVSTLIAANVVTNVTIHRFLRENATGWTMFISTKTDVIQVMTARGEQRLWKSLDAVISFCADVGWHDKVTVEPEAVSRAKLKTSKMGAQTRHQGELALSSGRSDHPNQRAKAK